MRGSGYKRNGEPDGTMRRAGVTAQKLRHVDLLLRSPFVVRLGSTLGFPLDPAVEVRLANPVSFIAQKLLIHSQRERAKRPQDVLYIHDTLQMFASSLDDLQEIWREDVRLSLPLKAAAIVEQLAREHFREVTDVIRTAARIPQDRAIGPERMRLVCAYGLDTIFGGGGA